MYCATSAPCVVQRSILGRPTFQAPSSRSFSRSLPSQSKRHLSNLRPLKATEEEGGNAVPANPLFNAQFASVLKASLDRQGQDALFASNAFKEDEDRKVSVQEQILNTALGESRKNIRQLSALAKEVESSLEREKKQFERLHFALKKAHADAAYLKSMERRLARKEEGLPE